MGILTMLMSDTFNEMDIASDMIKDSKFEVISLSNAVTEISNPELRHLLGGQLLTAIAQHHELSDLAASKEWYKPFHTPNNQVAQDIQLSSNANPQ